MTDKSYGSVATGLRIDRFYGLCAAFSGCQACALSLSPLGGTTFLLPKNAHKIRGSRLRYAAILDLDGHVNSVDCVLMVLEEIAHMRM
jgi:hypothetical protein